MGLIKELLVLCEATQQKKELQYLLASKLIPQGLNLSNGDKKEHGSIKYRAKS